MLHQFSTSMIRNRSRLVTTHPELATVSELRAEQATTGELGWEDLRPTDRRAVERTFESSS